MAQLPPLPQQVGIYDQFIARQTETLVIREKVLSLTGDNFEIKMANGQPILKVTGTVMSISGRKSFFDMANNHLFDLCKEHLHIHRTFGVVTPQGQKIMEVKSSFSLFGAKASATFTTPRTGKAESLQLKGNWLDTQADITDTTTGNVVVRIDRKLLSGRDILFGQQTYALVIPAGMDMCLAAALAVVLDEFKEGAKGGSLLGL